MVGEFVALRKTDAARKALGIDDVDPGDLRLFAAVVRELWNGQRFVMSAQAGTGAFIEPFGSYTDFAGRRLAPSTPHRYMRMLSVRSADFAVHRLAIPGAGHVRESGAAHHATRRLLRMVCRGKQPPFGFPGINLFVIQSVAAGKCGPQFSGAAALCDAALRQFIDRGAAIQQNQPRFFHKRDAPAGRPRELHETHGVMHVPYVRRIIS